jgi:hypothetical protein
LFAPDGSAKEAVNIRKALLAEVKKYPALQMQDLYKLAYQAAMGNEHMMGDTGMAQKYLLEEFASVDPSNTEPVIEYLTTDSAVVRVNLRSFKAKKGDPAVLLEAMLKTSSLVKPSVETLRRYWGDVESLAEAEKIPFKKKDLQSYFRSLEQQNFPAVSHSQTVEQSYHPAYRVIAGRLMPVPGPK